MAQDDPKVTGPRPNTGKGQQKTYDITGTNPVTGDALPPRTVTQEQWRLEKLGQQGYVKPTDLDETEGGTA